MVLVLVVFCGFWLLKGFGGFRGVLDGFGGPGGSDDFGGF